MQHAKQREGHHKALPQREAGHGELTLLTHPVCFGPGFVIACTSCAHVVHVKFGASDIRPRSGSADPPSRGTALATHRARAPLAPALEGSPSQWPRWQGVFVRGACEVPNMKHILGGCSEFEFKHCVHRTG